jgi:hypothetical protein
VSFRLDDNTKMIEHKQVEDDGPYWYASYCYLCSLPSCADSNGHVGFPHSVTKDDVYNGYFIPKDSIVVMNVECVPLISIMLLSLTCY